MPTPCWPSSASRALTARPATSSSRGPTRTSCTGRSSTSGSRSRATTSCRPTRAPGTDPYVIRCETTLRNLADTPTAPMRVALSIGTAAPSNALDNGLQLTTEYSNGKDQTLVRRGSPGGRQRLPRLRGERAEGRDHGRGAGRLGHGQEPVLRGHPDARRARGRDRDAPGEAPRRRSPTPTSAPTASRARSTSTWRRFPRTASRRSPGTSTSAPRSTRGSRTRTCSGRTRTGSWTSATSCSASAPRSC